MDLPYVVVCRYNTDEYILIFARNRGTWPKVSLTRVQSIHLRYRERKDGNEWYVCPTSYIAGTTKYIMPIRVWTRRARKYRDRSLPSGGALRLPYDGTVFIISAPPREYRMCCRPDWFRSFRVRLKPYFERNAVRFFLRFRVSKLPRPSPSTRHFHHV